MLCAAASATVTVTYVTSREETIVTVRTTQSLHVVRQAKSTMLPAGSSRLAPLCSHRPLKDFPLVFRDLESLCKEI